MRRNLCVGILRETREGERRAPLTPSDVNWLVKRGINVEVESSIKRIFKDKTYIKNGAKVLDRFNNASLLIGIKEPGIDTLYHNKIYMVFSHTSKGQSKNMALLKAFFKEKITLIDYEKIVDTHGKRLVYFGRFAGICGLVDSLYYLGKKLQWQGIKNPFLLMKPACEYGSLREVKRAMIELDNHIQTKGFEKSLSPFIIGITGHGNVSRGVQEVLDLLNPIEVHPGDMLRFIRHQSVICNRIYKIVFLREEKIRSKEGKRFYYEEYLKRPEKFESNLDRYLQYLNILIHGSYWDSRYPRMVTKNMIHRLERKKPFRLSFINDISCDIDGAIELTYQTTTTDNPVFSYDTKNKIFINGYRTPGITILAVDNLPSELTRDSSQEFGNLIRDYVYRIAIHGTKNIIHCTALPAEIRRAAITKDGKLTKDFYYLKRYI